MKNRQRRWMLDGLKHLGAPIVFAQLVSLIFAVDGLDWSSPGQHVETFAGAMSVTSTWSASAWAICSQRVHAYCAFCAPVVWWVLEQPASSTLEYLPIFQDMVRMIPCRRLHIFMSHYGGPTKKPTYLYSSHQQIDDIARFRVAENLQNRNMTVHYVDGFGKALARCRTLHWKENVRRARRKVQWAAGPVKIAKTKDSEMEKRSRKEKKVKKQQEDSKPVEVKKRKDSQGAGKENERSQKIDAKKESAKKQKVDDKKKEKDEKENDKKPKEKKEKKRKVPETKEAEEVEAGEAKKLKEKENKQEKKQDKKEDDKKDEKDRKNRKDKDKKKKRKAEKEGGKKPKKQKQSKKDDKIVYVPMIAGQMQHVFESPTAAAPATPSTTKAKAEAKLRSLQSLLETCPPDTDEETHSFVPPAESVAQEGDAEGEEVETDEEEEEEENDGEDEELETEAFVEDDSDDDDSYDEESEEEEEDEANKGEGEGNEEEMSSEGESEAEDDEEEDGEVKGEGKGDDKVDVSDCRALVPVVESTSEGTVALRNSVTNKRDWDKFCRQASCRSKFPVALSEHFVNNKLDLFNLWLDNNKSWEKCKVEVERRAELEHQSVRGWEAVQGKDLKKRYTEEKYEALVKSRKAAGLWYQCDDFPDDPDECWYFMRSAQKFKRIDKTKEGMALRAEASVDDEARALLTGEHGPLQAGALPSVDAVSKPGCKALLDAVNKVRDSVNSELARLLAWSFKHAMRGRAPDRGYRGEVFSKTTYRYELSGQVLACGWRACYFAMKGDLKARKQMNKFTRHYGCNLLCERCLAQTGKHCPDIMSYRNFGSAAWPMTEISHETYLQFDRDSLSPWACVDGWRLDTVAFDFLHMVYLGTGRDLFASGLRTLIERGVYEHTGIEDLDDLLDFIHLEMHRDCGEAGFYLPCKPVLNIASLGGLEDYAELTSRYKASHVKLMLWWLTRKCQVISDGKPDPILSVLATCLWGLQRVVEIMSESGIVLEPSSALEASQCLHLHLRTYAWLALHYHDQKIMFYKVRPKTHYLFHMANEIATLRLNFALFWTFDDIFASFCFGSNTLRMKGVQKDSEDL
ncbi:unnamed protein product [Durusdinium trenchii]|uniref:Uncharacterized protein n=1 Tax=Durusdinium trenchii TaxID=1381693 RepID=A0ABP0LPH3_9DINO